MGSKAIFESTANVAKHAIRSKVVTYQISAPISLRREQPIPTINP
jgi:hypothetical protein